MKTPESVAWLAGLIDGEGSIMLSRRSTSRLIRGYTWRPVISIANTDRDLLEAVQTRCDYGPIYEHKRLPIENHKRSGYTYRMPVAMMREWLPDLANWLITKRPQAILMLEYLEIAAHNKTVLGYQRLYQSTERYADIETEIKRLNKKGRYYGQVAG